VHGNGVGVARTPPPPRGAYRAGETHDEARISAPETTAAIQIKTARTAIDEPDPRPRLASVAAINHRTTAPRIAMSSDAAHLNPPPRSGTKTVEASADERRRNASGGELPGAVLSRQISENAPADMLESAAGRRNRTGSEPFPTHWKRYAFPPHPPLRGTRDRPAPEHRVSLRSARSPAVPPQRQSMSRETSRKVKVGPSSSTTARISSRRATRPSGAPLRVGSEPLTTSCEHYSFRHRPPLAGPRDGHASALRVGVRSAPSPARRRRSEGMGRRKPPELKASLASSTSPRISSRRATRPPGGPHRGVRALHNILETLLFPGSSPPRQAATRARAQSSDRPPLSPLSR